LGIHRDNGGVFSFSLHGTRTYLLWPPDHFVSGHPAVTNPDPAVIAEQAAEATRVVIEPGLGLYWPPGWWHVVLADGNPFVVAQVSAYFDHADV
jgi:ribosomal protein L16 Arg81 hydroxylase